jgi:hypothetical protein
MVKEKVKMLFNIKSLSIGTLDQNTAKGQNGYIALENAMYHYQDYRKRRFVVINVEGYDCIAHLVNDDYDSPLDEVVFPYDETRTYPIQGLEIKYNFKPY